jgi:hypothetical protein
VVFCRPARAEQAKPLRFELGSLKPTVTPPQGWTVNEGTPPSFFDMNGKKGSISFVGSPMQVPPETMGVMHKAALDTSKAQVKAGTYVKAEEHSVDGFNGVLTVESGKDPSIRRMQWIGHGRGGFYTIMMASSPDAFDGYLPTFEAFLKSVKFSK